MNPANLFDQDADALQLAPGDFLFREGDKCDEMYVLLEGEMDILLGDYVVETAGAGALIGVISLLDDSPRSCQCCGEDPLPTGDNRSTAVPFSHSTAPAVRDARDERAR
jgi:hypothetical protein